jgi:hypothetical protein
MHKKSVLALIFIIVSTFISFGQEHETVLNAPDDWLTEIIPFPLGFAREINLVGFEDLRFAPSWSDAASENYWTYMFVWYVEKGDAMTESKITNYFERYYDGLMGVSMKNNEGEVNPNELDETICLFVKTKEGFSGKMRVYDRFFSKDYMTLNIKVRESFCPKTNKQIIWCEISQKAFDHKVWESFKDVTLKVDCD